MNCLGCKSEHTKLINISDSFNIICCNQCQQKYKEVIETLKNAFIEIKINSNINQTLINGVEEVIEADKKIDDEYIKKGYKGYFNNTIFIHDNTLILIENLALPNVYGVLETVDEETELKKHELSQKKYIVPELIRYLMSDLTSKNIYALQWIVNLNKLYYKDNKLFHSNTDILMKMKSSILQPVEDKTVYVPFKSIEKLLVMLFAFCKVLEELYMFNYKPSSDNKIKKIEAFLKEKYGDDNYNTLKKSVPNEWIPYMTENFQYYLPYYMYPYYVRLFSSFDIMMIPLSLKYFSNKKKYVMKFKDEYAKLFQNIYTFNPEKNYLHSFSEIDIGITYDMFFRNKDLRWIPFITKLNADFSSKVMKRICINILKLYLLTFGITDENREMFFKSAYDFVFKKYLSKDQKKKFSKKIKSIDFDDPKLKDLKEFMDHLSTIIFSWIDEDKIYMENFIKLINEKFITFTNSTVVKLDSMYYFIMWIKAIKKITYYIF